MQKPVARYDAYVPTTAYSGAYRNFITGWIRIRNATNVPKVISRVNLITCLGILGWDAKFLKWVVPMMAGNVIRG